MGLEWGVQVRVDNQVGLDLQVVEELQVNIVVQRCIITSYTDMCTVHAVCIKSH